ncbi:MAG: EamA family transporter RarD [Candidatus Cloacimonetes bacterium]|nr:EamA family transporter RarD [Candidatus Cloacimonadota bacterium]
MWGVFPLYWKSLTLSPQEIICLRFILSFFTCMLFIFVKTGIKPFLREICNIKVISLHFISGSLLVANWYIYTWAVLNGQTIEASLGYFINPIVITLGGIFFFKENISKVQQLGVSLVILAVLVMVLLFGHVPYIAFVLAFTFSIYSFLRKRVKIASLNAFCLESMLMSPFCYVYLLWTQNTFAEMSNLSFGPLFLILLMGVVTASPLVLYGYSAKKVEFKTLGLLQYIAPILQFLIGLLIFHEDLQLAHKYSLPVLFLGLLLYMSHYLSSSKRAS